MSVTVTNAVNLGTAPYIYQFVQQTGFAQVVDQIVPPNRRTDELCSVGQLLSVLVTNRLDSPTPLYQIEEWVQDRGLELYLGCSAKHFNDDRLGRTLDRIAPYTDEVQEAFILKVVKQYQIHPNFIHYDLSSVYFEGNYPDVDWITLGYSRDHRPDKKQLNIGLNVTDTDPIPVLWTLHPGSTADTSTVLKNLQLLRERFPKSEIIQIGDRAMFSFAILEQARQQHFHLIAPLKKRREGQKLLQQLRREDLQTIITDPKTHQVLYRIGEDQLVLTEGSTQLPVRAIVVWSQKLYQTKVKTRTKKIQKKEQQLAKLKQKLNQPYYRKKQTIEKKLQRILGTDETSQLFTVVLSGTDGQLDLQYFLDQKALDQWNERTGFYILVTTLPQATYPALQIFQRYKKQYNVEWMFRDLKQPLKIRPLFVHKPGRIKALLFLIMVALVIYSLIEVLLRRAHLSLTPQQFFHQVQGLVLVQLLLDSREIIFQIAPSSPTTTQLLQVLHVEKTRDWVLQAVLSHHLNLRPPNAGKRPLP